jgi:UDP-N-acetylglucosamine 2-epimerase
MYCFIFGTRPEYLKIKPIITYFSLMKVKFNIIHILQHSDFLIDELDVITNIHIASCDTAIPRLSILGSTILNELPKHFLNVDIVIVQGDTATAFYSALCAFQHKIPIVHIEAGLRTYDLENPFPEEAYRSMISRIATYHMCPSQTSLNNLNSEKIYKNVYNVGNTILDQILTYNYTPILGNTVLITLHRRENWNSLDVILNSVESLVKTSPTLSFIWVLHMNPELKNRVSEHFTNKNISNIQLLEPVGHAKLVEYIASCFCIISDSGGIQEEASFLGKHCFILRKCTERSDIPSEYITLVPEVNDLSRIFSLKSITILPPCNVYGNGTASKKIYEILYPV